MGELSKLWDRVLGPPRQVESLVRNVMSLGFVVLLLLVVGVGYQSVRSVEQLERESVRVDATEENHLRLILDISETAGKIVPEARQAVATQANFLQSFPSRQRLSELKKEMDAEIDQGRQTSLRESDEWKRFEASYSQFWTAINAPSVPMNAWHDERENLLRSIKQLTNMVDREREDNNVKGHEMSVVARKKILTATGAVLMVGAVVALLAFYEIKKNLNRLARAYASSAESRDYLQSLLDSLVSGVIVIGQDGIVRTVSDSFRRLPVVGAGAADGESYDKVFQYNASLLAAVSEELSMPSTTNRDLGMVDLGALQFEVFTSPLIVGGEHEGVILVFVDFTQTARAQNELRRNHALAAIGQMTAQIAHEIKNPLGSIRFAAEFLRRQGSQKQTGDLSTIHIIERSVDHLNAIVAQLSDFARPKELNRVDVDLNALLNDLLPMVADRLSAKQIQVVKEYSADLPMSQYDEVELKKLFLNLIINAIEASEPASSLTLGTRVDGGSEIFVDIVDHGVGMDRETQKRLFEPFYTTKERGTGLGMAIAKQIAELHGGDLVIKSEEGAGTTATVRLPIAKFAEADNRIGAVQRLSR